MADAKLLKRDFVGPRMRRELENLIVTDVKLSKWNFYFYCRILHKISVVYSKFRNDTANILCSVLNSRLLKPTILKFSFMFIEFRYNLSFRVQVKLMRIQCANSNINDFQ